MKKSPSMLAWFAVVLLTFAEGISPVWAASAKDVVQEKLVVPLQQKDSRRSKFSRAAPPPHSRRVRITDTVAKTDSKGQAFVAFAIDESHAYGANDADDSKWQKGTITGCVYPGSGAVLVKRGDTYLQAATLWGERTSDVPAGACVAN